MSSSKVLDRQHDLLVNTQWKGIMYVLILQMLASVISLAWNQMYLTNVINEEGPKITS